MDLLRSLDVSAAAPSETFDVYDAETLFALWETSRGTAERLLPPPLRPVKRPLALAMVSTHPRTRFGPVYREAELALRAEVLGQEGFFCLTAPVTDNVALNYGRESLCNPKKVADIACHRDGRNVVGWVQGHGVRYFAVQAQLTGSAGTPDAEAALNELFGSAAGSAVMTAYRFKHFLAPNLDALDYPARLVREEIEYRPRAIDRGWASVALRPSEYDPWSEVEVVRMLGAVYIEGATTVREGEIVTEAGPRPFASYGQLRFDFR